MSKQTNPARTCTDCMHCLACHLWSNGAISNSVAPKCPQFEPARYASLAELQDLYGMHKGELVPVPHGRWVLVGADKRGRGGVFNCTICNRCRPHKSDYCPNCGAKMDKKEEPTCD